MTEGSDDGKNLVRVRAQVMMRDDSMGVWVPMGGGGLSNVSVRKRNIQPDLHDHRQEYLIYGKRISDQSVVLSCTIKKDFEYNKVMPTFHHWKTGDHKFGLTFQTAADARAFDHGVRLAVEDLLDGEFCWRQGHGSKGSMGLGPQLPQVFQGTKLSPFGYGAPNRSAVPAHRRFMPPFRKGCSTRYSNRDGHGIDGNPVLYDHLEGLPNYSPVPYGYSSGTDVEGVFMAINLPVERDGSRSSSGSVTTTSSSRHTPTTTPLPTPDHPSHPLHPTPPDPHIHYPHHHCSLPAVGGGGGSHGGVASTTSTSPSTTAVTAGCITGQSYSHSHANHHKITYTLRSNKPSSPHNNVPDKPLSEFEYEGKSGSLLGSPLDSDKMDGSGETYSYVEFDRPVNTVSRQEFHHYPTIEGKRDSIASIKKELVGDTQASQGPQLLSNKQCGKTNKNKRNKRAKCRHCHESFTEDSNSRGSCEYAPDFIRTMINKFTCITCAQGMLYHCMSDAEGDFAHHPCECGGVGAIPDESCSKRWLGLALLSLIVPCLWCYPPLCACHRCAVGCGICGGRHQAS